MRLLAPDHYQSVFEPLIGLRVGYVRPFGNVGDLLIEKATFQLLDEFGVHWSVVEPADPSSAAKVDHVLFGGGGNMGDRYQNNWRLRGQAADLGLPMTILPQSFSSDEGRTYDRVFVRERYSLAYYPSAALAPDLALGLNAPPVGRPERSLGMFLRRDQETAFGRKWWNRDPAKMCRLPEEYLALAARYKTIVTDRLHFAVSGLMAGREVYLLPNDYHKNRGVHETWLARLGCRFAESPADVPAARTLFGRFLNWLPARAA